MKRRITAFLISLVLMLTMNPVTFAADTPKDGETDDFNGITIQFAVGDSTLSINDG